MNDDYHAESWVIGCLLLNSSLFDDISCIISAEDFTDYTCKDVYGAITAMISEGQVVDMLSVGERLRGTLTAQQTPMGIFVWLHETIKVPFTTANIKNYAEIIREKSINRKIIRAASSVIADVTNGEENVLDKAQQRFASIGDLTSSSLVLPETRLRRVIETLEQRQENPGGIQGLSTGFRDIDLLTHGLHGGDLVVLAARPSMGKTLLGLNIAEYVAVFLHKPVYFFSMEMSGEQLIERSLASLSLVAADKLKNGSLDVLEYSKIVNSISLLHNPLFIDDNASVTVSDIRAKCRNLKKSHGLSLVVVDYIGLMAGEGENETLRIGHISRGLKLLARDLNVPVIAISQLNRGVEQRNNKRPVMADLRQSGAIEQDADLIMFIYRDEVYEPQTPNKGIAELIIAKHRNGNIGTLYLKFNGNYCKFENFDGNYVQQPVKPNKPVWRGNSYDE